jgi:hypothetical protein
MPFVVTPETFLLKRKLSIATYFALSLNFSYPVLSVLLYYTDPEEELTLQRISYRPYMKIIKTVNVKGRWITRPGIYESGEAEEDYVFLFSRPRRVFVTELSNMLCEAYTVSLGDVVSIRGQKIFPEREERTDSTRKWCVVSSQKFCHISELVEIKMNGFLHIGFEKKNEKE